VNPSRVRAILAVSVGVLAGAALYQRASRGTSRHGLLWPGATELHVPHLQGMITLDGDSDDSGWRGPTARTHAFVSDDEVTPARPHSEARFVWGDRYLYLNLYAADENILTTAKHDAIPPGEDYFHLVFTDATVSRVIDVSPLGIISDAIQPVGSSAPADLTWESHAHVSHELDGTPNRSTDHDEEWVIEMALPFESLGLEGVPGERIGLSMRRCDTPFDGKRSCGTWGDGSHRAVLVLDAP